ncbi:MAG: DNA-processing protein DprA [Thermodesulfobacteriota bacterium]
MKQWADPTFAWLALKMIPNLGNITYRRLLDRFGDPANVLNARLQELLKIEGIRDETARNIIGKQWEGDPQQELQRIKRIGAKLITMLDSSYPLSLKEIHDPPPLLYLKGKDLPIEKTMIAVVGSRNPSHYGLKVTEEICQGLAMRNIAVVSGMARGIDAAAHWGCLSVKGSTVAVLGSGIDVIYPSSNVNLYYQIADRGSVITEFPLGTSPEGKNFPIRNRIISGLSKGVVVVEASLRSGSLITASLALEQGREVFAVPGSIESFKSTGTHFLIKQGAKLVENADDILQDIGESYPSSGKVPAGNEPKLPQLEQNERLIMGILSTYPMHIDEIVRTSGFDSAKVAGILTALELKGAVKQLSGKMFVVG